MTIGDKIKATHGYLFEGETPLPVYDVAVNDRNEYIIDDYGCCNPVFIGGVKPGTIGTVDGNPIKAQKVSLKGYEKTPTVGGIDTVMLYPVMFEFYQKVAWISVDHFLVTG